ncbi:MAG: class I SAM-dependent methyltransferase, partial [Planctomycetales bacterium]|nr:class I SAM-dependent methyltransferase [Planctomycetales bacterium]
FHRPSCRAKQWQNYDRFKNSCDPVQEHYDGVRHCHSSSLSTWLDKRCMLSLDIACGYGESTRTLKRFSETVVGVDSSAEMIRIANEQGLGEHFQFVCSAFEEYDPGDLRFDHISATWYLNHIHDELSLVNIFKKIDSMLAPGGSVSFVVPSDSFTSRPIQQLARELMNWQQAWTEERSNWTKGVFSYGEEWIPTTIWQPLHLMRLLDRWFDMRTWDVKGTIVREHRMNFLDTEPPFEILFGTQRLT